MVQPVLDRFRFAACMTIMLIAAVLGSLTIGSYGSAPGAARDDWRRTANGWERAAAWPKSIAHSAANLRSQAPGKPIFQGRFDTHPAALALAELVGSLIALAVFASPSRAKTGHIHWTTILSRSFRASAFGS
jgi:hypothetical protein